MNLTLDQYFAGYPNHPEINDVIRANAALLLAQVNRLCTDAEQEGIAFPINPATRTQIAGEKNGGWRPQECPIGAPSSAHKQGMAVDIYDPEGSFDDWLTDDTLMQYALYREDPGSTRGWCHLTTRAPRSGKRTFFP